MESLYSFIGFLVCLVIVIGVAAALTVWMWEITVGRFAARKYDEGVRAERARMSNAAWWFSEDHATTTMIQALALGKDTSATREEWRRRSRCVLPDYAWMEAAVRRSLPAGLWTETDIAYLANGLHRDLEARCAPLATPPNTPQPPPVREVADGR